jgi:Fur family ferric uptake transcriptional regulator
MTTLNWIRKRLQDAEHKWTQPRADIARFLATHDGIFSATEILRAFRRMDKVSVYRTLELLASLDIIHPATHMGGIQYYELHAKRHHHHAICTQCKKIAHIACTLPKKIVRGFSQIHHSFLLTGLCTSCTP